MARNFTDDNGNRWDAWINGAIDNREVIQFLQCNTPEGHGNPRAATIAAGQFDSLSEDELRQILRDAKGGREP